MLHPLNHCLRLWMTPLRHDHAEVDRKSRCSLPQIGFLVFVRLSKFPTSPVQAMLLALHSTARTLDIAIQSHAQHLTTPTYLPATVGASTAVASFPVTSLVHRPSWHLVQPNAQDLQPKSYTTRMQPFSIFKLYSLGIS